MLSRGVGSAVLPLRGNELGGNLTWDPPSDPLHVWAPKLHLVGHPKSRLEMGSYTQMLNVWPIYLQNWVVLGVNVGNYTIH